MAMNVSGTASAAELIEQALYALMSPERTQQEKGAQLLCQAAERGNTLAQTLSYPYFNAEKGPIYDATLVANFLNEAWMKLKDDDTAKSDMVGMAAYYLGCMHEKGEGG